MKDYEKPGGELLRSTSGRKNAFKRLIESCRSDSDNKWRNA